MERGNEAMTEKAIRLEIKTLTLVTTEVNGASKESKLEGLLIEGGLYNVKSLLSHLVNIGEAVG